MKKLKENLTGIKSWMDGFVRTVRKFSIMRTDAASYPECPCWCHCLEYAKWDKRSCNYCGCKLNGENYMSLACDKEVTTRDRTSREESFIEKKSYDIGDSVPLVVPPKFVDNVNHPPHYNNSPAKCECGRRIECIDVTRHMNFNIGNAIKYLWRCDIKNAPIEDLRKAMWYIQDEIKNRIK
jgi:Protein of unknwon function (DUF3310)